MTTTDDEPSSPVIEEARTLPAKSLDFWFDYTCPFAYLGSTQAPLLAQRMGVALTYKPLLLGGVFKAVNTPQNLFATRSAPRSAHENADMQRWAKHFGVPLTMPSSHPMRSVEALRATLATGVDPKVIAAFFRAYWVDGREISSAEVIREVVSGAGHDADAVLARISEQEIKDELRKRTEEGIRLGIFGVPVWIVDGEHFYWGQDRMMFVEGKRRVRVATPAMPRAHEQKTLHVYWDFSSPFAYLGEAQIQALAARTNAKVEWHPILLGGLFKTLGGPEVPLATFSEAKQMYILKDIHRWAEYWGLPFKFPSRFPIHSLKALRVYLALPEERRGLFRAAAFRAGWAEDRDITDDKVLAECVGDEAIARQAFSRMGSDEVKAALRASTDQAALRGVFGVPTFIVGDDLFWGQDRLMLVEQALMDAATS